MRIGADIVARLVDVGQLRTVECGPRVRVTGASILRLIEEPPVSVEIGAGGQPRSVAEILREWRQGEPRTHRRTEG